MFDPHEIYMSVTPLDVVRVNRTVFHNKSICDRYFNRLYKKYKLKTLLIAVSTTNWMVETRRNSYQIDVNIDVIFTRRKRKPFEYIRTVDVES